MCSGKTIVRCYAICYYEKVNELKSNENRISSKWKCVRSIGVVFILHPLARGRCKKKMEDCQLADMSNYASSQRCKNIAITTICFDTIDKRFVDSKRFHCRRITTVDKKQTPYPIT